MRIPVAGTVTEFSSALIVPVSKMSWHLSDCPVFNRCPCIPNRQRGAIALWGRRQIDRCLRQVELGFGEPDMFKRAFGVAVAKGGGGNLSVFLGLYFLLIMGISLTQ